MKIQENARRVLEYFIYISRDNEVAKSRLSYKMDKDIISKIMKSAQVE